MASADITPTRLEAFSDGVIAIIITIMVLELKVPHSETASALLELWPVFLSYALSYLFVAVYWMNHHHMFHMIKKVDTPILWTNLLLLFCVSLIPFATAYMGENHFSPFATQMYCGVMLMCGCAFYLLLRAIVCHFPDDTHMQKIKRGAIRKNKAAIGIYTLAIIASIVHPAFAILLTFAVKAMYFLPSAWVDKQLTR